MAKFNFATFSGGEAMSSVRGIINDNFTEVAMGKPMDSEGNFYNINGATFSNVNVLVGLTSSGDTFAADASTIQGLLPNPLVVSGLSVTGTVSAGLVSAATVSADLVSATNGNFTNLTVSGNTTLGDNIGNDTITLNGRTIGSNASFNNLTVTGNTTLGDSSSDTIILNGTVQGTHFGDIRANSVMANTLTFNGTLYEPDPFSSISEVWVPYQPYIIGTNSSVHPIIDGDSVDLTANKLWIEVSGSNIFLNVYIPLGRAGNIAGYYRCQLTERPST